MSYIVQRKDRFYVVAYDGLDPFSGKERRRWHPVGRDREEAEAVRQRLDLEPRGQQPTTGGPITVSTFLRGARSPGPGQRLSWQPSSTTRDTIASTPLFTWPLTPACAAVRSSDSSGATSTRRPADRCDESVAAVNFCLPRRHAGCKFRVQMLNAYACATAAPLGLRDGVDR